LVNSRQGLVTATPRGFLHLQKHPFSRSYGANLPSSLAGVRPLPLACSASLPVSVCGTVTIRLITTSEVFLGSVKSAPLHLIKGAPLHHSGSRCGFTYTLLSPCGLEGHATCPRCLSSCVTPLVSPYGGAGILTRFPSATPFGFTLGYRLTLGGRPFPRYP